ncbi:class I SAM-dependent methyltransferase [Rhodanobacter sp. B2A1Ga4]|nr:class I SAM-dependent methyltransferase [Rhodanobacter sp. B2A1Ga4]
MDVRRLYLEILKKSLMHSLWYNKEPVDSLVMRNLKSIAPSIFGHPRGNFQEKIEGRVWPQYAHTMIGLPRLNNLQLCMETAINEGVEGDFIETGVWRGGACIFMRGILKSYGISDRVVWVADSFEGLPRPNEKKAPADKGDKHHTYKGLAVGLEEVRQNFELYSLLDEQVKFLKGWFKDTLPSAPISKLAVCRLDGDMYESTMDSLNALYPKISIGGFLIIDDYGAVDGCRKAVDDYRAKFELREEIIPIDWGGVYWRKVG